MESLSIAMSCGFQVIVHLTDERCPLFELDLIGDFTIELAAASESNVGQVAPTGGVISNGDLGIQKRSILGSDGVDEILLVAHIAVTTELHGSLCHRCHRQRLLHVVLRIGHLRSRRHSRCSVRGELDSFLPPGAAGRLESPITTGIDPVSK